MFRKLYLWVTDFLGSVEETTQFLSSYGVIPLKTRNSEMENFTSVILG